MRARLLQPVIAGVLLMSAAIAGPAIGAEPTPMLRSDETLLEVSGEATYVNVARSLTLIFSVSGSEDGKQTAKARADALIDRLKAAGAASRVVAPREALSSVSASLHSSGSDANLLGEFLGGLSLGADAVLVQAGYIAVPDLGRALAAGQAADLGEIKSPKILPMFGDSTGAKSEATGRALADARTRADGYARGLQLRVGRVLRVSERTEGPLAPVTALAREIAQLEGSRKGGSLPLQQRVRVQLSVDYALVRR